MNLYKTIILPSDDPVNSSKLFDETVYQHAFVLLVVKGAGQKESALVQLADNIAGGQYYTGLRRVLWVQEPSHVQAQLAAMRCQPLVPSPDASDVTAFAVNLDDEACDAIKVDELPATKSRVLLAFKRAEV